VQTYGYKPFGELTNSPTESNPFQFTGRENDGAGLMYYRARYYVPEWGRFISEDPEALEEDVNLYAYAGNKPVNATDPTGRFTLTELVTVPATVNGLVALTAPPITSTNTPSGYATQAQLAIEEAQAGGCSLSQTSWWNFGPQVRHHLLPREFRSIFSDVFKKDLIDDYTVQVPRWFNQWVHSAKGPGNPGGWWNQEWRTFFTYNKNPSAQQVWQKMEQMRRMCGIRDLTFVKYR
jgi:RHS repeat-associated protein